MGGCALTFFANNFIIFDKSIFKNIYIPFAPGDNGGALGAAFVVGKKYQAKLKNLKSPYLGNNFTNEYIETVSKMYLTIWNMN